MALVRSPMCNISCSLTKSSWKIVQGWSKTVSNRGPGVPKLSATSITYLFMQLSSLKPRWSSSIQSNHDSNLHKLWPVDTTINALARESDWSFIGLYQSFRCSETKVLNSMNVQNRKMKKNSDSKYLPALIKIWSRDHALTHKCNKFRRRRITQLTWKNISYRMFQISTVGLWIMALELFDINLWCVWFEHLREKILKVLVLAAFASHSAKSAKSASGRYRSLKFKVWKHNRLLALNWETQHCSNR